MPDLLDPTLDFVLPPALEASAPPEARGLSRDAVRLLVTQVGSERATHALFRDLPDFLEPGDVVVINTSGTFNAALPATDISGQQLMVHLSTHLSDNRWSVEVRALAGKATAPYRDCRAGDVLRLPAGAEVTLLGAYRGHSDSDQANSLRDANAAPRLWLAALSLPQPWLDYVQAHGTPIHYSYVHRAWPSSIYQTVYATEMGSAEMPSAGRAFTPEIITRLVAKGVQVVPLLLHTGVASLEDHEPPYAEWFRVPAVTAMAVNASHQAGCRVVAVGTTVVRALESVTDADRLTQPAAGWTDLVITPQRGLHAVDALLTGFHEPRASHLAMLEALAGRDHLRFAYAQALHSGYLWHEFGDLHLLLGGD